MDRRNFFKLVGTASGGLVTGACGKHSREVIPLLVPAQEIVPGVEEWHPSVCRECAAGCGVIVRVMEAERGIEVQSQKVRQRIAAIKKLEGNPLDPVSGGRLCARGQAAVQGLYHPDRVRSPLKRSGDRGQAAFAPLSWDDALAQAATLLERAAANPSRIVFLSRPGAGSRQSTTASFLAAFKAPPPATLGISDFTIERKAAEWAFGWHGLPLYEIQDSDFVLGIGADFLGGWVSPVLYARRFGHMRQGRAGRRGRLVQAESRFSMTAGAADSWVPVKPGGEHAFALAIGHALVEEKLARADAATAKLRDSFASVDFARAADTCGVPADRIRQAARDLAAAETPVVLAGASVVHTGSLEAVSAANALNWLIGSVGRAGGVHPPIEQDANYRAAEFDENLLARLESAELLFLDGANPAYVWPASEKLLAKAPAVVSFSPFIDDSTAYADLVLPDHFWLESAAVVAPASAPQAALTGAPSFVQPLYDTRTTESVLADLAKRLGRTVEIETTARAYERVFSTQKPPGEWTAAADFTEYCERQGGWWTAADKHATATAPSAVPPLRDAEFAGDAGEYPLHFQPYPSMQYGDGAGANVPWLEELPDPVSSAMWGLPVEVDPQTAQKLGIANGDLIRVVSPHGRIEAQAYVHPAAIPGVVSMGIGHGHTHYTRFASKRGANPLSIVAPATAKGCGVFAFGSTRVRVEKIGRRAKLIQFSYMDREPEITRRST